MKQKIAVIIYGPPGSGKGTQAKLLSEKLNFFHFDTGDFLRNIFYGSMKIDVNKKEFEKEKKLNESGKLNTTSWILKIVSDKVKSIPELGHSVILSGSPRTLYEAFGDKTNNGLFHLLTEKYGKKNIFNLVLEIPERESIKRNSHRIVCSVCKTPLLGQMSNVKCSPYGRSPVGRQMSACPFCGGKLKHRKDDKKEVIIGRLKEYRAMTEPIFKELKKRKFKIFKINGISAPYKVHEKILNYFR